MVIWGECRLQRSTAKTQVTILMEAILILHLHIRSARSFHRSIWLYRHGTKANPSRDVTMHTSQQSSVADMSILVPMKWSRSSVSALVSASLPPLPAVTPRSPNNGNSPRRWTSPNFILKAPHRLLVNYCSIARSLATNRFLVILTRGRLKQNYLRPSFAVVTVSTGWVKIKHLNTKIAISV